MDMSIHGFESGVITSRYETKTDTKVVSIRTDGAFSFDRKALRLLVTTIRTFMMDHTKYVVTNDTLQVMHKLSNVAIELAFAAVWDNPKEILVWFTREDVKHLRDTTSRYLEQEEAKGPRTAETCKPDEFNDYITAKLMLIDFREWLSVACDID